MMQIPVRASEIGELLREVHQATCQVGVTMNRIVPFPAVVTSPHDAKVLDLAVSVSSCDGVVRKDTADVVASVRYATALSEDELIVSFGRELASLCPQGSLVGPDRVGSVTSLSGVLSQLGGCTYEVEISTQVDVQSVRVTVTYAGFDYREAVGRFASWHGGCAPVAAAVNDASGFEVETFRVGNTAEVIALYTTHYACADTSTSDMRMRICEELQARQWGYSEPEKGSLFVHGAPFEAEAHVFGNDSRSGVHFVGEFRL